LGCYLQGGGTRQGSGKCQCYGSYTGETCEQCSEKAYEVSETDGVKTCAGELNCSFFSHHLFINSAADDVRVLSFQLVILHVRRAAQELALKRAMLAKTDMK
jgi:hypothetical protein